MLGLVLALSLSNAPVVEVSRELPKDTITLAVGHHFALGDAHARVQLLLEYWARAFGVRFEWVGERVWVAGSVWGVKIHAYLEVAGEQVRAVAADPGWLRNSARDYVTKKLKKYLHPQYAEPT